MKNDEKKEVKEVSNLDKTLEHFHTRLNCAQSILATYGPSYGLAKKDCFRIVEAFGGGIAHNGNTCGAILGALAVIGLKYGRTDIDDLQARDRTNNMSQNFISKFISKNGSDKCRNLIKYDISNPEKLEEAKEKGVFVKCDHFVKIAVELLEEIL